jgi:toxin YoeB
LGIDSSALGDLAWRVQQDRKNAPRILRLIQETQRDPFAGIGKPEPLKHELAGRWSKRIDEEHRFACQATDDKIRILACRDHY